ncbi:MAG TPA: hypothetical protein VMV49_10155 [Candidatus Deferrimicrobium sp.]|nr:hypothetical protein [Candidatus Deferrimicrobium sp.]
MAKNLSPDEENLLRFERAELIAQAESFLVEDDYEILPELFNQIAEISMKLGEIDLAEDFKNRAKMITEMLVAQDTSFESQPAPSPTTSSTATAMDSSLKVEESELSEKLKKLKNLVEAVSNPRIAPMPAIPTEQPRTPLTTPLTKPTQMTGLDEALEPQVNPDQISPSSLASSTESGSLIEQRMTEKGVPLESGIVPTIVKDEKDVLYEILVERLPLLPDAEKQKAVDKLLSFEPGAYRDAWLKVFLIKNKKYAR